MFPKIPKNAELNEKKKKDETQTWFTHTTGMENRLLSL